jgi:hypothetical protein
MKFVRFTAKLSAKYRSGSNIETSNVWSTLPNATSYVRHILQHYLPHSKGELFALRRVTQHLSAVR